MGFFLFIVKTKRTHHPNFITFNTANKDVFFVVDETNMISGMIFYLFFNIKGILLFVGFSGCLLIELNIQCYSVASMFIDRWHFRLTVTFPC